MGFLASIGKLFVELEAKDGLTAGFKKAEGRIGGFSSKMENAGRKISDAGGKLTTRVSLPLVALGGFAVKAASDMEESMSKVNVVFGRSAGSVSAFADTASTSLGQSKQQALEALGTFGNLFRAMNIGTGDAAKMSQGIVQLASDLASFNNASPEETLLALRAGLVGETEPLRRFGVNLSAARIQAEAMSLGLIGVTKNADKVRAANERVSKATKDLASAQREFGVDSDQARAAQARLAAANKDLQESLKGQKVELTASQKATAAYSVIMKDTALAQGDFERTSDGVANKSRIVRAQLTDVAASFGEQLLPLAKEALGVFGSFLKALNAFPGPTKKMILAFAGGLVVLGPFLKIAGTGILVFGKLGKAVGRFTKTKAAEKAVMTANNKTLNTGIGRFGKFGKTVGGVGKSLGRVALGALRGLGTALLTIGRVALVAGRALLALAANPIVILIAAIAAIIFLIFKFREDFVRGLQVIWQAVVTVFNAIKNFALAIWNAIFGFLSTVWNGIVAVGKTIFNVLRAYFTTVFNIYKTVILTIWNTIKAVVLGIWNVMKAVATTVFNIIKTVITTQFNIVKTVVLAVINALKAAWNGLMAAGRALKDGIVAAFNFIKNAIKTAVGIIMKVLGPLVSILEKTIGLVGKVGGAAKNIAGKVGGGVKSAFKAITPFAHGGTGLPGQIGLVGEAGAEIIEFQKRTTITPLPRALGATGTDDAPISIEINNPKAEPSSTSIPAAMRRAQLMRGR